jgi:signal transduction histidine kinase
LAAIGRDNLFERVYESLPVPVLLVGAGGSGFFITAANTAFCRASGQSCSSLEGQDISTVFPEKPAQESPARLLAQGLESLRGEPAAQPLEIHDIDLPSEGVVPNGAHGWKAMLSRVGNEKDAEAFLITFVEARRENMLSRRAEDAERGEQQSRQQLEDFRREKQEADETSALLQAIFDGTQAGIFLLSPMKDGAAISDFRMRLVNSIVADYLGESTDALTGAPLGRWLPGYRRNGLFEKLVETARSGSSSRFEFHYDDDGLDVWLDLMCAKVNGDVLVSFVDFTALKNLQRRLEDHVAELRSSNANLEQFAYVASHDLQEPLRKVKSFGDMLQTRYAESLGTAGADLVTRMQSAAARMGTLIDDLLTYSRASVKPAELNVIDTNKVLDGALLDLERAVQQRQAVIYRDRLLPVAGQATQVGQIFSNLIGNGLKFQRPGVPPEISIRSSVKPGREAGIPVNAADADKMFQVIRVMDNGIGFENSYRERIFQIFHRLNNRTDFPGSGVGLSIVKKVVENHNGYIQADSIPGEGATFTVLLPMVGG